MRFILAFLISMISVSAYAAPNNNPSQNNETPATGQPFLMSRVIQCGDFAVINSNLEAQMNQKAAIKILTDKGTYIVLYFSMTDTDITLIETDGQSGCLLGYGSATKFQ